MLERNILDEGLSLKHRHLSSVGVSIVETGKELDICRYEDF